MASAAPMRAPRGVRAAGRGGLVVRAETDYGLGLAAKFTAPMTIPASGKGKVAAGLEGGELPLNTYGNKAPFVGKIVSVERIVGPKATGETTHIIIDHQGKMPYFEGQSYGVIPPASPPPPRAPPARFPAASSQSAITRAVAVRLRPCAASDRSPYFVCGPPPSWRSCTARRALSAAGRQGEQQGQGGAAWRAPVLHRLFPVRRRLHGQDCDAVRAPRHVLGPGAEEGGPGEEGAPAGSAASTPGQPRQRGCAGVRTPKPMQGICSNFLCDAKPGTEVMMTGARPAHPPRRAHRAGSAGVEPAFCGCAGPTGKVMLLPEDQSTAVIMVATGTGIAPFRSFIRRFFLEDIPGYNFKGLAWLFMGVANSDAKLYDDEFAACTARFPAQFRLDYALSREANNRRGGKMYIQDKVEEYKDQIFDLLNNGAHMYFCGLKGMMPGILEMLEGVCKEKGLNYEEFIESLKHKGQWHVEVY